MYDFLNVLDVTIIYAYSHNITLSWSTVGHNLIYSISKRYLTHKLLTAKLGHFSADT